MHLMSRGQIEHTIVFCSFRILTEDRHITYHADHPIQSLHLPPLALRSPDIEQVHTCEMQSDTIMP